jgi:hypothetical protein
MFHQNAISTEFYVIFLYLDLISHMSCFPFSSYMNMHTRVPHAMKVNYIFYFIVRGTKLISFTVK